MFASLASALTLDEQPSASDPGGHSPAPPLLLLLRELLPSLLFLANCGAEDEVLAEVRGRAGRDWEGGQGWRASSVGMK